MALCIYLFQSNAHYFSEKQLPEEWPSQNSALMPFLQKTKQQNSLLVSRFRYHFVATLRTKQPFSLCRKEINNIQEAVSSPEQITWSFQSAKQEAGGQNTWNFKTSKKTQCRILGWILIQINCLQTWPLGDFGQLNTTWMYDGIKEVLLIF